MIFDIQRIFTFLRQKGDQYVKPYKMCRIPYENVYGTVQSL